MTDTVFRNILISWAAVAVVVFITLFFVSAPYGRHFRKNFGPAINGRIGWILMEAPAPLLFFIFFFSGIKPVTIVPLIFLIMWESHYVDRSFIYPLTLRRSTNPLPLTVLAAGICFNAMNAYLNSRYITEHISMYSDSWLSDIRFLLGIALFLFGFIINRHSDYILYRIRRNTLQTYGIPRNGLYRWVSCPNYLGEIFIWTGWTVATWSPVAAVFCLWSIANLVPRARAHHRWYRQQFDDYPDERRILMPWLW